MLAALDYGALKHAIVLYIVVILKSQFVTRCTVQRDYGVDFWEI